ncbi:hypothetical protein [Methanothrix sp.]
MKGKAPILYLERHCTNFASPAADIAFYDLRLGVVAVATQSQE